MAKSRKFFTPPTPNALDRPTALTPEVQREIVEALLCGNYLGTACRAAGISHVAWYYWRNLWRDGAEHAQKYDDFFKACERAMAKAEVCAVDRVFTGSNGWQGPAHWLERRHSRRWGKKDKLAIDVDMDLSKLSTEELRDLATGQGTGRSRAAAKRARAGDR